jgi:hypothetical protein
MFRILIPKGGIFCTLYNTVSSAASQISVSEDAGIEPRTVATLPLGYLLGLLEG